MKTEKRPFHFLGWSLTGWIGTAALLAAGAVTRSDRDRGRKVMNDSTKSLTSGERADSAILGRAEARRGYCLSSTSPSEFSAAPAGARDRDRSRRPARPGRPAATVLVLGLLLLGAAAAEAQTSRILVSNVSQAADEVANTSSNDHAQLFHTGDHTDGYTLTSVIVVSEDLQGDAFDVDICTADGTSDDFPTTTCTALTAPGSFPAGNLEFTHSGLALSAGTNYVVVVKSRAGVNVEIDSTTSGGEDSTSIDTDWSIKGYFYWKNSGAWTRSSTNEVLQITVNGYEVVTTPDVSSSIEFTTTPSSTTYGYNIHETIPTTVTFSAAVDITGTPQLELDFAGSAKAADCTAATNTTTMVCTYTVVENDSAPNGIAIAANKLTLNGGTITATGSTTLNADLAHAAVAIDAGQKVEGIRPTLVTTGSDAPTTSTDGTKVILTFSEIIRAFELAKITIMVNSVTVATSAARATGTKVEIDLTTAGTTDSLSVNWTAPSNTGPAIDNYDLRYREGTGGSWTNGPQNVSGTSATIGSLTTSTSYQVQVLATNAEGDSPWSLPGSGQTGALGAPDVPHSLDATPGNRQVMLSWVLPSGGAEVTDYEYEQDFSGTWISTGSTDTDYTVRNLTNGQPYTFRVRAANSAGASAASAASPSVTPATVPGAPTGLGATVSDQRVDLIWTAPASNGGQSITDYEYEQGGSGTWISTGSTATSYMVHNLTNGQLYRFRVRAVNSVGAGAASAASPNITPATEPDAPTGLSATVSDQEVDLIWTAPAANGGAPILRYEYELDFSGTWTSTGGTATSYTVTGLTNGQFYWFRVRAVNRVGAGLASSSQSATPTATVVAPDAPFGLSATPGNRQVMLSWVQPSGGAALTHYEYEQDGSGTWTSTGGKAPSYTVTGLTNGQFYTFRVRAVNSAGASAASGSRSATPTTTEPEAPESLSFTPGDQQVTLRWRAPTNDGGEPITHYEYEQDGSGTWISTGGTATSHTVRGLNNG